MPAAAAGVGSNVQYAAQLAAVNVRLQCHRNILFLPDHQGLRLIAAVIATLGEFCGSRLACLCQLWLLCLACMHVLPDWNVSSVDKACCKSFCTHMRASKARESPSDDGHSRVPLHRAAPCHLIAFIHWLAMPAVSVSHFAPCPLHRISTAVVSACWHTTGSGDERWAKSPSGVDCGRALYAVDVGLCVTQQTVYAVCHREHGSIAATPSHMLPSIVNLGA